jgi:ferredoxin
MTLFYFTATGNSLDIAKKLASKLGARLRSIPQEHALTAFSDNVIGVIFPVYAWNIPAIVTRFLRRVALNAEYKFAVVAHGGDPGNIGGVLAKLLYLDNVYTVETWSNYLPFNSDVLPVATDASRDIEAIASSVASQERKGFPYSDMDPFNVAPWAHQAMDYRWRKDCTACGICAKVCPAANYIWDAGEPDANGVPMFKFSDHCEGCMACLQNCPTAALHMPNEPTRYRYRNPNITLDEIIAANEQRRVSQ